MKVMFSLLICVLITSGALSAKTWHVPNDFKTIQEAIAASTDGDLILVKDGKYYENISFMGKKITVASHFYLDRKKRHIRKTIINGSKPADPKFASVVSFVSGEDTNSVLCGFTITGGSGTLNEMPDFPPMRLGGGILCYGSGAKIIHNRIIKNTLKDAPWAMGGGISISPPFLPLHAVIENNEIKRNEIFGQTRVTGGGINFSASGRVINNVISHNTASATVEAPAGGGIALQSWDPTVMPPNKILVTGNVIKQNKALQPNDATFWLGGIGAGLWLLGSEGVIEKNIISHNEASGALSTYGSGVLLDYPPDDLTINNNIISKNYFSGSGTCYGGGLGVWDGNPLLMNNLFIKNKGSVGGAVWLGYNFCSAQLINNTITDNHAEVQGGAINSYNSTPALLNSILWDNEAPLDPEICLESGTLDVSYCDIAGGWTGDEIIDSDPMFRTPFYLLAAHSPCIDAGHSAEIYNDPKHPFRPNLAMFPARGTVRNDLGAYGGPGAAAWRDLPGRFDHRPILPPITRGFRIRCFPNPFNARVTIEFTLASNRFVDLKIFNILGQQVAELAADKLAAGTHRFNWDANEMASGVYFYRLRAGDFLAEKKLILLK